MTRAKGLTNQESRRSSSGICSAHSPIGIFLGGITMRSCEWLARLVFALTLACAGSAFGQSASGSIQGTVKDETGAVLPGATVTITNTDTSHARTLATDAGGRFVAPDLPPGPYEIK